MVWVAGIGQVGICLSGTVLRQRLHRAIPISRTTFPVPGDICLPAAVSPPAVPSGPTPFAASRSAPLPAAVPAARRGAEGRPGRASLELERGDDTKKAQLRTQITTSATKRRQRVLVIEDSLLRHTEAHIFCPDNLSREACSLPAAHVRDVKRTIT